MWKKWGEGGKLVKSNNSFKQCDSQRQIWRANYGRQPV